MAFQAVTAATPLSASTYAVDLAEDWCIGSVPNGGYVASVLLSTARKHAAGTLSRLDQPDTMHMQLQFLRRTRAGPGIVTIRHVKLGQSVSVIHATLSQDGREEVAGYLTQTNFVKQEGLTLPTSLTSSMSPAPPAVDLDALEQRGEDAGWDHDPALQLGGFRKAVKHLAFYRPKHRPDPSLIEQWVRFRPGGPGHEFVPFESDALGFVVDMFPQVVEQYPRPPGKEQQVRWYPTVALNLDIKKRLPPEGVKWLYVRVRSGQIRDGRMDLQILVLDASGDLVALSSHVALILSASRNTAERSTGASSNGSNSSGKL